VDRLTGRARWGGAVLLAALAGAGCSQGRGAGGDAQPGLGRLVAPGVVKALVPSADGAWLAWLDGCVAVKGRFLQPGTASCDLSVARSDGTGAPTRVARAVTSLPHGLVAAPQGSGFAALADYDYEAGAGTLLVVHDGAAKEVAKGVTFHGFVPGGGGALAAVAAGRLVVAGPDGARRGEHPVQGLATFELAAAPEGGAVGLARQPSALGGALYGVTLSSLAAAAAPIAAATAEYRVAPADGAFAYTVVGKGGAALWLAAERSRPPRRLADGARTFDFAPAGGALAWISEAAPGRQGDLHVAAPGVEPQDLAREVGEHRWAARAPRLAWLEQYDPRSRSGVLGTGGPGLPIRTFGKNVTDFELSADGARLAFLRHTTDGGYSVDLELADTAAPPGAAPEAPARKVAKGVFGFAFSPDGAWLYYRTRCTRNAEACDLERVRVAGPSAAAPELVAAGAKSFEFDPRDAGRLLLTWQRSDLVALDLAVWQGGKLTQVDRAALPGSIRFLGPDSRRLAYAVVQPKRAGVHVAALP